MEKLNIDKVAQLAHVSRSVVSRVLNNHPNVSEEARERVMKVVVEHNYKPNTVARNLATQSSKQIGVLTSRIGEESLGNGYWSLLYLGIFEECIRRGYYVHLSFYSASMKKELYDLILNEHNLDGVICLNEEVTEFTAKTFSEIDMPIVVVGHNPAYPEISSVDVDNYKGAYKGVEHLVDYGHKNIGGIFGDQNVEETKHRIKGYQDAQADHGVDVDEKLITVSSYSQKDGYQTMNKWLNLHPRLTAVFCASDTLAMGAMLALHERNVKIPEEFSVVGFDGLPISRYMIPPLTTVAQPTYGKGEIAAKMLIDRINKKETEIVHQNLEPELIVRKSCAPAPVKARI